MKKNKIIYVLPRMEIIQTEDNCDIFMSADPADNLKEDIFGE